MRSCLQAEIRLPAWLCGRPQRFFMNDGLLGSILWATKAFVLYMAVTLYVSSTPPVGPVFRYGCDF